MINKKAILVVSFGSSYEDAREKNISAIENEIGKAFADYRIYRAFTSQMILKLLKRRDGIQIDNVEQAMKRMKDDGIRDVIVQPTHVINGIENERMLEAVAFWEKEFDSIRVGNPLLTKTEDYEKTAKCIADQYGEMDDETALVLMGHGTDHDANAAYQTLENTFKTHLSEQIFMVTVEAYPTFDELVTKLKKKSIRKLLLAPLMVVAGDHARNDMAGDGEDSLKSRLEAMGYTVECRIEGLGEYKEIRKIYCQHIAEVLQ